jgi:hypothetical protein
MLLILSARLIRPHLPNHHRALFSDLSQGHSIFNRGIPKHQHPRGENARYVKLGTSQAEKSHSDPRNLESNDRQASRKKMEGVGFQHKELKQGLGAGQGLKGTGATERGFHTSSESDTEKKKSSKDRNNNLPSDRQKTNHPESPSDRVYEREANKAKEAVDMSYEPNRPSGDQDKLRYGGKQNWSKESEDDKGASGPHEGPEEGSAEGRKPERG